MWETPPCGGVKLSHERRKDYTIFLPTKSTFFDSLTGCAVLYPHPKGRGFRTEDFDKHYQLSVNDKGVGLRLQLSQTFA